MTVLIVDDNPDFRRVIRTVIAVAEADVVECANGVAAIAAYAGRHPDAVLMDLDMPGLDGMAATRQIRAADPTAHHRRHQPRRSRSAGRGRARRRQWLRAEGESLRAAAAGEEHRSIVRVSAEEQLIESGN
jgi:hypothetical protein